MKWNDLKNKLLQRISHSEGDVNRRPDGGTSCYRPIRRKNAAEIKEQEEQQQQPMTYIHTGFTGMNPPSSGYDPGYGADAYGQQPSYNPQAPWNPQPAYGQTAYGQPAYGQSGAFQTPAYGQQTEYMQQPAFGGQQPAYEQGRGGNGIFGRGKAEEVKTAARPERGWFPPREEAAPRSNISYMPGYAPDAGAVPFNHVEHIMTMTGLKSCYEAIECMKNGETLIIGLDAIANETESMRCQDMLAGAAFTLGCNVRMLQGARLVLIAPENVKILPEEIPARQPEIVPPAYAAPAPETVPLQRERRSGRNAADWNAARSGQMENYNPYTGTMPVAAGAYGSFGGYGY